jgi:hypothetical protein
MAGRKQRGRGGGRGFRGGRGPSRGGGRGGRGGGRGRGRGLGYATTDEIDDDFVVVPACTSGHHFWHISFMCGALQTPKITRGEVRRLLMQVGGTNTREEEAMITSQITLTAWTTATTIITRGSRLPFKELVPAVALLAETDISVGAVSGGSPGQT